MLGLILQNRVIIIFIISDINQFCLMFRKGIQWFMLIFIIIVINFKYFDLVQINLLNSLHSNKILYVYSNY